MTDRIDVANLVRLTAALDLLTKVRSGYESGSVALFDTVQEERLKAAIGWIEDAAARTARFIAPEGVSPIDGNAPDFDAAQATVAMTKGSCIEDWSILQTVLSRAEAAAYGGRCFVKLRLGGRLPARAEAALVEELQRRGFRVEIEAAQIQVPQRILGARNGWEIVVRWPACA
jgi:hypothetical protein